MYLSHAKWSAAALLLLAAGASAPAQQPRQYAQVVVREQIIVKMRTRPPQQVRWKESKGPKCIPARAIAGAAVVSEDTVDLMLRDNRRIRIKLDNDCPALGYYPGFYVTPNADGMICAGRDSIRSRIGGRCEIDRFRTLQPILAKKKD